MHLVHDNRKSYTAYERDYLSWYQRKVKNAGEVFDPVTWIRAVREQYPQRLELAIAFARCTRAWRESGLYTYFLSYPQREANWKYAGGVRVEHPEHGLVLVDLIQDPAAHGGIAIGGVEYIDRVLARGK